MGAAHSSSLHSILEPLYLLCLISALIPYLPQDYYLRATHHAGPGKHRVVDRVRGDIGILSLECDINHDEIMNVFKIISNLFLGMLWTAILNDQITRSSDVYLVGNVAWQDEMTIAPADFDLIRGN